MRGPKALLWALSLTVLVCHVTATRHNMFVSSFRTRHLFALSYDDETGIIQEERAMMGDSGHTWMTFNVDKTILYASQRDAWTSYKVLSPSVLARTSTVPLTGYCNGRELRHGETSIFASKSPPFYVYGSGRSPCGTVMNIRSDGSLNSITQSLTYSRPGAATGTSNSSRVEGFAMTRDGKWMFSADSRAEGIWTHSVDARGTLGSARFTPIRIEDVRPRRLVLHPSGSFLYVLCRRPTEILTFELVPVGPGQPPDLRMLDVSISLVPTGLQQNRYRGAEISISEDGKVLFASVRYREPRPDDDDDDGGDDNAVSPYGTRIRTEQSLSQENLDNIHMKNLGMHKLSRRQASVNQGIVTAVLLSNPSYAGGRQGYPLQIIMQASTPTSGGRSNIISPAPWNSGVFALSDSDHGFVQIWRIDGLSNLPPDGPHGQIAPLNINSRPQGPLPNIRASIVGEWHAPAGAVGDPRVSNDDDQDSIVDPVTGTTQEPPIPSGRGCCANAVWLN